MSNLLPTDKTRNRATKKDILCLGDRQLGEVLPPPPTSEILFKGCRLRYPRAAGTRPAPQSITRPPQFGHTEAASPHLPPQQPPPSTPHPPTIESFAMTPPSRPARLQTSGLPLFPSALCANKVAEYFTGDAQGRDEGSCPFRL